VNGIITNRSVKAGLFLLCLAPLAGLAWGALRGGLVDSTFSPTLFLVPNTWIRRIPASPKATKPRIDRLQTHVVDFRQFLTVG